MIANFTQYVQQLTMGCPGSVNYSLYPQTFTKPNHMQFGEGVLANSW